MGQKLTLNFLVKLLLMLFTIYGLYFTSSSSSSFSITCNSLTFSASVSSACQWQIHTNDILHVISVHYLWCLMCIHILLMYVHGINPLWTIVFFYNCVFCKIIFLCLIKELPSLKSETLYFLHVIKQYRKMTMKSHTW